MKWRATPIERGVDAWRQDRERGFRLIQRVDPVFAGIAAAIFVAVVLLVLIFGGLRALDRSVRPVPDNRILGSFTERGDCFVETAAGADGTVWTSLRSDPDCQSSVASGGLAPYDPVWRLWGREAKPFSRDTGEIDPTRLAQLDGSVWVGGDTGGLAVRPEAEDWQVWLSQSIAPGDGKPLEQLDVAAVTVMEDPAAFVVATRGASVVRYTPAGGRWATLGQLGGQGTIHGIVATQRHLWAWRGDQIRRYRFSSDRATISHDGNAALDGVVDVIRSGRDIIVHTRRDCLRGTGLCDRIHRIGDRSLDPQSLLDATGAPRDWSASDIRFVAPLGPKMLVAGTRGAVLYDTANRQWEQVEERAVLTFASRAGAAAIGGDGFAVLVHGDAARQPVSAALPSRDNRVRGLSFDSDGRLHVASERGSLWSVAEDGALTALFTVTAPRTANTPRALISNQAVDLFMTNDEAVVLDRATRTYRSIPATPPLRALAEAELRHFEGAPVLAATPAGAGRTPQLVAVDPAAPERASMVELPGGQGANAVTLLPDRRSGLLTTSPGRLFEVTISAGRPHFSDAMAGQPQEGMSGADINSLSALEGRLVLGGSGGITLYDPETRLWRQLHEDPVISVSGSAQGGMVFSTTPQGALRSHDAARGTMNVLLGAARFPFAGEAPLADALVSVQGDVILLGADGRGGLHLHLYDPKTRTSAPLARFAQRGPLDAEILTYRGRSNWLVRVGPRVYVESTRPLDVARGSSGVQTGWREPSGAVVTLQRDRRSGIAFLHRQHPGRDAARCVYRGATFDVGPSTEVRALPNGNLAAFDAEAFQLYEDARHRWFPVALGRGAAGLSFASAYGAVWGAAAGRTGPNGQPLIWQLPASPNNAQVDSCAVGSPVQTTTRFEMAAISPAGDAIVHLRGDGAVMRTHVRTGRSDTLFRPPDLPAGFTDPLRFLATEEHLWLAFENGVLAYDPEERRWLVLGRVSGRGWTQVTLERGRGALSGQVVASYSAGTRTELLAIPANDPDTANIEKRSYILRAPLPAPLSPGARSVLEAWAEGTQLVLRFPDAVRTLDTGTGTWDTAAFGAIGPSFRIGEVNTRLVGWDEAQRRFVYQGTQTRLRAYTTPLMSAEVPAAATPFVQTSGDPGYFTPEGALFLCGQRGQCPQSVAAADPFELSLIRRGFVVEAGFVLLNSAGQATFVDQERRRLRRIFGGDEPAGQRLQDWMNEPLAALWPSKDGRSTSLESAEGEMAQISRGRPVAMTPIRALSIDARAAFNPDEGIVLTTDGTLAWRGGSGPLPTSTPVSDVRAVGRHAARIWWLTSDTLFVVPQACITAPPGEETSDEDVEACEPVRLPAPQRGRLAYLEGDWEDDETPLTAQLKSGERLELGRNFLRRLRWSPADPRTRGAVDVTRDIAPLLGQRPDGVLTLAPTISVQRNNGLLVRIDPPQAAPIRVVEPVTLRMDTLDASWLRFDLEQQAFLLGSGDGATAIAADEAFEPNGLFRPLAVNAVHFQGNGSVLLGMPDGLRTIAHDAPLLSAAPASVYRRLPGRTGDAAVLDDGGAWQGARFEVAPRGVERRLVPPQTAGALRAEGDRSRPGVTLMHGVNRAAWITGSGFAWDHFDEIGWTQSGTPVLQTPVGVLPVEAPLSPAETGRVLWSAGTFERLMSLDDFHAPEARHAFTRPTQAGPQALAEDTIRDAAVRDGDILLATPHGLKIAKAFDDDGTFIRPGQSVEALNIHRPTGLAVLDGGALVFSDAGLRPPTSAQTRALRAVEQARIGPLSIRSEAAGYSLWLNDDAGRLPAIPALSRIGDAQSRLALDTVTSVASGRDGALLLSADIGHAVAPRGDVDLAEMRLHLKSAAALRPDVAETPEGRFALMRTSAGSVAECRSLDDDGSLSATCPGQHSARVVTLENVLGTLTAVHDGRKALFNLAPAEDRSPALETGLRDGRFDHDRITHVAACHGHVHYFTRVGLHLRQPDRNPDWTTAPVVARRSAPTWVQCPEAFPRAGLADTLMVHGGGPMVDGNLFGETPHMTFLRAESADRYIRGPALPTTPLAQSRVMREDPSGNLLEFTTALRPRSVVTIGGTPHDVGFIGDVGPGAYLDVPEGFAHVAGRFWAVTRDGFIPLAAQETGLVLARDGPPVQELPAVCRGASVRTNWVNSTVTDLWCGSIRYELSAQSDGTLQVQRATGPRSRSAGVGGLVLRADEAAGLSEVSVGGERNRPGVFAGGFAFDVVMEMAATWEAGIALVTEHGWQLFRGASLSLDTRAERGLDPATTVLRRGTPGLRQATRIEATHNPWVTCVVTGARLLFVRADADGVRQEAWNQETCLPFLGSDGTREAWLIELGSANRPDLTLGGQACTYGDAARLARLSRAEGLPIFAFRFPDGLICDRIESGRFLADTAVSLPLLRPVSPRQASLTPYCASSANAGVAIVGPLMAAQERVQADNCIRVRQPEPAVSDNALFRVEDGVLLRQRQR